MKGTPKDSEMTYSDELTDEEEQWLRRAIRRDYLEIIRGARELIFTFNEVFRRTPR